MPNDTALLIGVEDYRAYDGSADNPPGTSDLRGSVNDVRAWLRLCEEIGVRNVRVLTSPPLELDMPGVECRPATAREIRDGVAWLSEQLGASSGGPAKECAVGLLMFSGHGDQTTNEGLVLCPSDVEASGDELSNVVSLHEIQRVIAHHRASRNLTVVLDCCHGGGATVSGNQRARTLRPSRSTESRPVRPLLGERTFFAAPVGGSAYQGEFGVDGCQVNGAFTWAFMTVKNRWSMLPQGSTRELTISCSRMRDATRDLLRSLEIDQTPEFDGMPGMGALPIFHRGLTASAGETSGAPQDGLQVKQCDPGIWDYRIYTFMQGSTKIADMLVARNRDPSGQYSVGYEYWMMSNVPQARSTTTVSMVDYPWTTAPPDPRRVSFTMIQDATWTARPPSIVTDPLLSNPGGTIGIQWKLTLTSGVWGGSIIWSRNTPPSGSNPNTLFAGPAQTQTLTMVTSVPSTLTYNVTCYPRLSRGRSAPAQARSRRDGLSPALSSRHLAARLFVRRAPGALCSRGLCPRTVQRRRRPHPLAPSPSMGRGNCASFRHVWG